MKGSHFVAHLYRNGMTIHLSLDGSDLLEISSSLGDCLSSVALEPLNTGHAQLDGRLRLRLSVESY